jgi:hypothetical protein
MYFDTLYVNQVNVIENYWKNMLYHYTCLPVTLVTHNETNDCPFLAYFPYFEKIKVGL